MHLIYVTLQMEGISAVCWHSMAACGAPRATGTPAKPGILTLCVRKLIPGGFCRVSQSMCMEKFLYQANFGVCFMSAGNFSERVHPVFTTHSPLLPTLTMLHARVEATVHVLCLCSGSRVCGGGTAIRCCCICSWCQLPVFPSGQASSLPAL